MAQKHVMPAALSRLVGGNGLPTPEWLRYLSGLEEVSGRVATDVEALPASPTNEEIAIAFNALLTALQGANLQETP